MNLYDYIPPQAGEAFSTLLEHKNVKINRIVSSDSLDDKLYVQEEDEWLVLIEGEATLLLDNEEKKLKRGETLFIPKNTPHRILSTHRGTVWLTVHIF